MSINVNQAHELAKVLAKHNINEMRLKSMVDSATRVLMHATLNRDPFDQSIDNFTLSEDLAYSAQAIKLLSDLREYAFQKQLTIPIEKGAYHE